MTTTFVTSGTMRSHPTSSKILSHVSLKKSLQKCSAGELLEFYKGLSPSTYPALHQHAIRMASLFGSTYICEKTFSTMAINKSKLRSKLTVGHLHAVLHIATTEMEPDIRGIVTNRKQHHKSHAAKKRYVDLVTNIHYDLMACLLTGNDRY